MVIGIGDVADKDLSLKMSSGNNWTMASATRRCKRRTRVTSTCRASCGLQIGGRASFSAIGVDRLPRKDEMSWIRNA